jgi:arsenate reductase
VTLACHELTPRESELWAEFVSALRSAGLPTEDLAEPGQAFFTFHDTDRTPVGFGGYLLANGDALLRSIVVTPSHRRRGLGSAMLTELLSRAAGDAHTAWLLTMDADAFFARHAFARKERAEAPPAIAAAPQFTSICPASAVLMCRRLR